MNTETITRLDHVVGMIEKRANTENIGAMQSISVRLPIVAAATVEAFAKHSGRSKNKVLIELLELAIEEVTAALSDKDCLSVLDLRSKILFEMVGDPENPNVLEQAKAGD